MHAVYAPETQRVRLDRLSLDLGGGAQLVVDGRIDGVTRGLVADRHRGRREPACPARPQTHEHPGRARRCVVAACIEPWR